MIACLCEWLSWMRSSHPSVLCSHRVRLEDAFSPRRQYRWIHQLRRALVAFPYSVIALAGNSHSYTFNMHHLHYFCSFVSSDEYAPTFAHSFLGSQDVLPALGRSHASQRASNQAKPSRLGQDSHSCRNRKCIDGEIPLSCTEITC